MINFNEYDRAAAELKRTLEGLEVVQRNLQRTFQDTSRTTDTIRDSFSAIISKVDSFNKVFKTIKDGKENFKSLKNAINTGVGHFNNLKTAIAAAGGAKTFVITKFGTLKAGITAFAAKMPAAIKGQLGLNAAMKANPIGLKIAAVAALIAGITALVTWFNRNNAAIREQTQASREWLDRQREMAQAAADRVAMFQEEIRNIENTAKHYRNLVAELEQLLSQTVLTTGEIARMHHIINILNSGVDGLTLAFDEQTGALNMTMDAIDKYLSIAERQALLDADLEKRNRLQQDAIELSIELAQAAERVEYQEKRYNETRSAGVLVRNAASDALEYERAAFEEATRAMENNQAMQEALTDTINYHAEAIQYMTQAQEEAAAAVSYTTEEIEEQAARLAEWERAQTQAISKIERAFESYKRIASNAFSQVSESAALSAREMTANLEHNTQAVEAWSKNLAELTERGVDEGLIEQLRRAGVEGAATVRALVEACDDELDALNEAFADSTRVAVESMQRELDPSGAAQSAEELIDNVAATILENSGMEDALITTVTNAFNAMGREIDQLGFDNHGADCIDGFVSGIYDKLSDVDEAAAGMAVTYMNGIRRELGINSPSKETHKVGVSSGEGLIRGTKAIQPRVAETARTLARAFVNGIADTINRNFEVDNAIRRQVEDMRRTADMAVMGANFDSIGFDIVNGVARGIMNGGGIVASAASNMINNALAAMRAAAAINSPSRKAMQIADHIGDGLIIRMKAKGQELADVCKRITSDVMDKLHIDPGKLIGDTKDVLRSIHALESNIRYTTNPLNADTISSQHSHTPPQITITGNQFHVREEGDINKVAKQVMTLIQDGIDQQNWSGGVTFA